MMIIIFKEEFKGNIDYIMISCLKKVSKTNKSLGCSTSYSLDAPSRSFSSQFCLTLVYYLRNMRYEQLGGGTRGSSGWRGGCGSQAAAGWGVRRAHLQLDEELVGAQREAGGEEHRTLLFRHRLCALPLTALDFLQELPG